MSIICEFCDYTTMRNYDLKRHQKSKHKMELNELENIKKIKNEIKLNCFYCQKCYKSFTRASYAKIHESKCDGFDSLTCKRCMISFSSPQSKSNHSKRNNCKPRSISEYINPYIINNPILQKEIQNKNLNTNITNNSNNINNYNTTNNIINNYNNQIIINEFGKERNDYLKDLNLLKRLVVLAGSMIVPTYIKYKHFNILYPENQNIKHIKNKCLIKRNNIWEEININDLSQKLLQQGANDILLLIYPPLKEPIENILGNDIEKIEQIKKNFNYIEISMDEDQCPQILKNIITVIKTGVTELETI